MIEQLQLAWAEGRLSVRSLSEATAIPESTIYNILSGRSLNPGYYTVRSLYNAFTSKAIDTSRSRRSPVPRGPRVGAKTETLDHGNGHPNDSRYVRLDDSTRRNGREAGGKTKRAEKPSLGRLFPAAFSWLRE